MISVTRSKSKVYQASFIVQSAAYINASSIEEASRKAKEIVKQKGGMKHCTLLSIELSEQEELKNV